MKRRTKYLLFCLVLLGAFLAVLFTEPSRHFLFANATGDCSSRATFMFNALYKDTVNAQVALFGSSRTMNGVNDSLMNASGKTRFLNMGYCRFGRNIDYFFIEEYCRLHHPKKIVLEVRESEGSNTHPVTPFFLSVPAIAQGIVTGKGSVAKDLYDKWLCNLKFIRSQLFGKELYVDTNIYISYGFSYGSKPNDIEALNTERRSDSLKHAGEKRSRSSMNANSAFYFNKLKALADERHIQLLFLFMPSYGNLGHSPEQQRDYEQLGNVLLPPDSILKDARNFSNYTHLNKRGADRMGLWLLHTLGN